MHLSTNVAVPEPIQISEAGQSTEFDVSNVIAKIWNESPIEWTLLRSR